MSTNRNCAKILIKLLHQRDQIFSITQDELNIGRGEESDLVLPNVSVSRVHAVIRKEGLDYIVADPGSQNGFRVNQQSVKEHVLTSGDEIQIGIFTLVFLGPRLEDNYYRGRSVVYLPPYDPKVFEVSNDNTYVMSNRDKNMLARKTGLLHNGCVIADDGVFFYPEGNPLSFGKKTAIIQVNGWFVFGTVAKITWNNKEHLITKESWMTTVKVNGHHVKESFLRVGDTIQIGSSHFTYDLREGQ